MSLTDRKSFLKILIIVCFAFASISAASLKIQIDSVSLSAHQFIPAHGQENGGTVLYVSGSGFNAYGKGMSVYFGPYQCNIIQQESTTRMIACRMASMLKNKGQQNLPVTVYMVNSLPASCYKNKCLFSFQRSLISEVQTGQSRILNEGSPIVKAECTAADQYFDSQGVCQSCANIENSPGTATSNHRGCNCNSTFVWVAAQDSCVCPLNFILVNGACLSCAPVKTRNGTGKGSGEACQCNNAEQFTFNVQQFKCVCTDPDSFVTTTGQCFSCADKITNGTGKVNGTFKACACKPTFIWNPKLNDCYCSNDAIYLEATSQCFSCSKLKGKNGTGLALPTNVCQCLPTFTFNPQTNTCACPDAESFIDKTSGGCVSCANVANSTFKANVAGRSCICNSNYTWNPAKSRTACLCPDNSFVMDNDTCFLCSKLKGKNSTGLVSKANNFSCQCLKSFVFNTESFTCLCPDENSYIDKTGLCVSCTNIGNGTSEGPFVNIPGKRCICKDNTFIWTPTLKTPACICPSNSVFLTNGSCFICSTLKGKNGTGLVNTSNTLLCGCLKSYVFNPENGVCECPEINSYVDKTLGCIICTDVENSPKTANFTSKQCNCNPTFIWNSALSTKACLCPPNSFILPNLTCFTCTRLKGKNGTGLVGSDNSSCQCLKTFSFNKETGVCECTDAKSYIDKTRNICIPCNSLGNATGEVNVTQNVCICLDGFVFTPSINKLSCICPPNNFHVFVKDVQNRCVNCNTLKGNNSKGLVNKTNGKSCQCDKSFVYNSENHACECPFPKFYIDKVTKLCVACTLANGSFIGNGTGQVDANKCVCIDPSFIWTPTLKVPACICRANSIIIDGKCFLCASNKTNYLTGFIFNSTTCACKKSFVFNPAIFDCQCPDAASYIDKTTNLCISCVNAKNGTGEADTENKKCKCLDDTYVWVPTLKPPACLCLPNSILFRNQSAGNDFDSCFSCTILKGALKGTGGVSATNRSQCACIKTFVFDTASLSCICPFTNSYINTTSNTCITCKPAGNNIGNGTGQISPSGQGCVCNDATLVWNPARSLTACLCPPLAILITSNNTCFLCSSLSLPSATGKVNATNNKLCECVRTYTFNVNTLQCQCPDANSFISTTKLCVICTGVTVNGNGTVNEALNGCNCDENYTYSPSLNRCLCQAPYRLVSGSCILRTGASSLSAASCPNDMIWDNTLGLCVCAKGFAEYHSNCIDCKTIENSNGQTGANRTSCKCNSGYNWSANQFACISS